MNQTMLVSEVTPLLLSRKPRQDPLQLVHGPVVRLVALRPACCDVRQDVLEILLRRWRGGAVGAGSWPKSLDAGAGCGVRFNTSCGEGGTRLAPSNACACALHRASLVGPMKRIEPADTSNEMVGMVWFRPLSLAGPEPHSMPGLAQRFASHWRCRYRFHGGIERSQAILLAPSCTFAHRR